MSNQLFRLYKLGARGLDALATIISDEQIIKTSAAEDEKDLKNTRERGRVKSDMMLHKKDAFLTASVLSEAHSLMVNSTTNRKVLTPKEIYQVSFLLIG